MCRRQTCGVGTCRYRCELRARIPVQPRAPARPRPCADSARPEGTLPPDSCAGVPPGQGAWQCVPAVARGTAHHGVGPRVWVARDTSAHRDGPEFRVQVQVGRARCVPARWVQDPHPARVQRPSPAPPESSRSCPLPSFSGWDEEGGAAAACRQPQHPGVLLPPRPAAGRREYRRRHRQDRGDLRPVPAREGHHGGHGPRGQGACVSPERAGVLPAGSLAPALHRQTGPGVLSPQCEGSQPPVAAQGLGV